MNSLRTKRLIVCDPACVQPFGHNVIAMKYFAEAFRDSFRDVVAVVCNELDEDLAAKYGFRRCYRFYYDGFLQAENAADTRRDGPSEDGTYYFDPIEQLATADTLRLIDELSIGPDDVILFPHLDFYGVVGLCNALARIEVVRRPSVLLRFIGVMENATNCYQEPTQELIARIRQSRESGTPMAFSAEAPKLADFLAVRLQTHVPVTPFPNHVTALVVPASGPFTIYCPGSARHDKGFMDLLGIFRAVRIDDPDCTIQFMTQNLPYSEARNAESYISQLYALPGVELFPSAISESEMVDNYSRSCAILLPYDVGTYRYRGSAAMMESVGYGRPVITVEGTAFADQVRYYGLGDVVETPADLPDAIMNLARTPRSELQARMAQARYRFVEDASVAYDRWLRSAA